MTDVQAPAEQGQPPSLAAIRAGLERRRTDIDALLKGSGIDAERFIKTVIVAVQSQPKLLDCTPQSLWLACQQAARDGLLPDGHDGAIVIRKAKNSPRPVATWQIMVGGLRKKVRQSDEIATWEVYLVHANDQFEYELGDAPHIMHRPSLTADRGAIVGAYSVATLKSGEKSREVMSVGEINAIRDRYSESYKSNRPYSPWTTAYGEMCRKTVLRRHSKVLPMSGDLDEILRRDEDTGPPEPRVALPKPAEGPRNALDVFAGGNGHAEPEASSEPPRGQDEAAEEADPETGELAPRQWET
jgi:recombination protein RecT